MRCNFCLVGSVHDTALSWRRVRSGFLTGHSDFELESRQCPQPTATTLGRCWLAGCNWSFRPTVGRGVSYFLAGRGMRPTLAHSPKPLRIDGLSAIGGPAEGCLRPVKSYPLHPASGGPDARSELLGALGASVSLSLLGWGSRSPKSSCASRMVGFRLPICSPPSPARCSSAWIDI